MHCENVYALNEGLIDFILTFGKLITVSWLADLLGKKSLYIYNKMAIETHCPCVGVWKFYK